MRLWKNFSQPVLAYAPSDGVPEMIDAVVNYYGKIDAPITNKQVLITTGGSEALQIALSCILDEGDEIIIPEPFYPNYSTFVTLTGATIRPITTTPEENYKFAIRERVEACINEHTRAILFTNPGNPTGTILTEEELKLMADIAKEHNLFIIGDEVYREFVYGGEKLMSLLQLKGYEDNVVVIDSVSKRFSACGARIGCVITRNSDLYNNAMKWCQGRLCASTIDQVASAALYTVGPEYFDAVRKEYKARRDTLVEGLKKIPGVIYSEPKGAFYVMAKLPVDDAEKFQLFMLEEFDDNGDTLMFTPAESFYKTPHTGVKRSAWPTSSIRTPSSAPWSCLPRASKPTTTNKLHTQKPSAPDRERTVSLLDFVCFLPAFEIEQHDGREHAHAAEGAERCEFFVEHEDADQRRHDRLKRRKDGRLTRLEPCETIGIEQIRQIARDDAERRAQAEALPRTEHDAERLRRAPDDGRADGGQQAGIKVDGVARIAAVERVAGKDAVERIAEARAEAVENADRGELVLPADERHQTAPGKRQHKCDKLLRRDVFVKQKQ